ncbi:MAG: hypothetical protein IPI48_05445 [bacterium]|nr:hypothetical protein [bacterium]
MRWEKGPGSTDPAALNLWATGVNATGAVVMTPLFPGWGQLYADGGWRAALAFGAEMYFWSNLLSRDRQARRDLEFADTLPEGDLRHAFVVNLATEHKEQMRDFVWWSGGALLIIALDAYVGAHLFNFDEDAVPVPDRWEDVFGPVGFRTGRQRRQRARSHRFPVAKGVLTPIFVTARPVRVAVFGMGGGSRRPDARCRRDRCCRICRSGARRTRPSADR